MNDNDIVKALECCANEPTLNCRNCPYEESCNMGRSDMQKDALDLINRQKEEIERLEKSLTKQFDSYQSIRGKAKAEAIKEFAERLKERKYQSSDWSHGEHPYVVEKADINEILLEEMTEETP